MSEETIPLGQIAAAVRLGVIRPDPIDKQQWNRCMEQQVEIAMETAKARASAALDKVSVILAKAHATSIEREAFMKVIDKQSFAADIDNEKKIQKMLADELDFVGALIVEVG
jgi:hypothetical protein